MVAVLLLVAVGLFFAWRIFNQRSAGNAPQSLEQASRQNINYYISFDDYYYEVPKKKTADDKIVLGAQFIYDLNTAVKTNTLDDLFNVGAIGVQALVPLNGENQAFEHYINDVSKPAAASAFSGTADLTFSDREKDKIRVANLVSKKDGHVIRRQYIVNLPQSVAVVAKEDEEAFRLVGQTIAQASKKFSDYEAIKILILAESSMIKNRMLKDIYDLAHPDLRNATSIDELTKIADRNKEIFGLEPKVSGAKLSKNELSVSVLFIDSKDQSKNKGINMFFRYSEKKWKLFSLVLPKGSVSGVPSEQ